MEEVVEDIQKSCLNQTFEKINDTVLIQEFVSSVKWICCDHEFNNDRG